MKVLKSEVEICTVHVARIKTALKHLENWVPLTQEKFASMSEDDLAYLELLTSRFCKLQDHMGQKIFPLLLIGLNEDVQNKSFLDLLHKLEKLNIIPSVAFWSEFREIRNVIAHEYPDHPELLVAAINRCHRKSQELLAFWVSLEAVISHYQLIER